eukprot:795978-Prorocentrum_minimum.AAC.2
MAGAGGSFAFLSSYHHCPGDVLKCTRMRTYQRAKPNGREQKTDGYNASCQQTASKRASGSLRPSGKSYSSLDYGTSLHIGKRQDFVELDQSEY